MAKRPQPNALVAAATKITLSDPKVAQRQAAKAQQWQPEEYAYADEVPEIKEAVRYRGNQVAKVRLFAAVPNPDDPDGDPIPVSSDVSGVPPQVAAAAEAELARLRSVVGGQPQILRMLDMNLETAGECYLVGFAPRVEKVRQRDGTTTEVQHPEDWQIKSVSEVLVKDGKYAIRADENDQKGTPLRAGPEYPAEQQDTIIRIWTAHPQWGQRADSAMRALLGECRTLQVLSQQVLAQAMRSVSAGFFTVPNELSFGPPDPTQDEDQEGAAKGDPLNDALNAVLVTPIDDPSNPSTVQPGIIRGPAEYLKPDVLRRITFYDASLDTVLEQKIEARVQRIARGLNLPVEKVMGHQQTTFANAAQVDQDEYEDYLAPSVGVATEALTEAFMRPQLRENPEVPPEWSERIIVAADPSGLIANPDTEKNADGAHDRRTISDAAYRKAKGFSEDDAPTEDELLRRVGLGRGIFAGPLTLAMLDLLGVPLAVAEAVQELQPPPPEGAPADDGGGEAALAAALVAALARRNGHGAGMHATVRDTMRARQLRASSLLAAVRSAEPDHGRRLQQLDADLRTRLTIASNDAMGRALERAGNRLRSRTNGTEHAAVVRTVPAYRVASLLPQALVADAAADALAGAWDELEAQFFAWGANAQGEAIDVAGQVAAGFTAGERTSLQLRQADDLADAWVWMRSALQALAVERLLQPDVPVPELGEFDPNLRVPTGLVRQAMARAGGATGLITEEGGVWLTLTDGGTRPAGGIGTGELLRGAMRDHGAMVEAYRWVYGPAFRQRPFLPHQALDGVVFRNFDDPVLANTEGWPETAFYMPGDHAGCICDFEPIIVPADEVA